MSDYNRTPVKKQRFTAQRMTYATLVWSKAFVPVVALLAALASSVRTMQTTAEIYEASGSPPGVALLVALAFALAVEGALFVLALAQEHQNYKWRQARKKRRITSLMGIWRSVQVRIGLREPLSYDQLPESDGGLALLVMIAFLFAAVSNFNIGLRPLLEIIGETSLQSFLANIMTAQARIQLAFIVDVAAVLFPPLMALKAGHLAARYAMEVSSSQQRTTASVERSKPAQLNADEPAAEQSKKRSTKGAAERVVEYLNEHPESTLSQNQLARELNVSVGTVNTVFKRRIELSSNGHRVEKHNE